MPKRLSFENEPDFSRMDRMLSGRGSDAEDRKIRERTRALFGDDKASFVNEKDFNERFDALRRLLPQMLANEPLVIGAFLQKMLLNPGHDGMVLVDAWKLRFEGKK